MEHDGAGDWEATEPPFDGQDDTSGLGEPLGGDNDPGDMPDAPGEPDTGDDPLDDSSFGDPEADDGDGDDLEFTDLSDDQGGTADDDPGDDAGDGPDDEPGDTSEPVVGVDPDLDMVGDDPDWHAEDPFPPQLDVGETPEPVDGFPWSDPAVLGEEHDTGDAVPDPTWASPAPDDLLSYDARDLPAGADPWQALINSDDPATSSLARWWSPDA
ncbi:MAG: hypothetical protein WCA46_21280 [Actinocatenispora sp.]